MWFDNTFRTVVVLAVAVLTLTLFLGMLFGWVAHGVFS